MRSHDSTTNTAHHTTSDQLTLANPVDLAGRVVDLNEVTKRTERLVAFCLRQHGFAEAADLIDSGEHRNTLDGKDFFDLPWPEDDDL